MNFRSETCHVLFPLAAASSAVLHSILAFAAAHRAAHITTDVESRRLSFQAASLQTKSIHDLQAEVMAVKQPAAVLATSLMLCLGVLCHGGGDYSSWRIYLLGAKASLYALCGSKSTSNMDQIPVNYLKRRYELLETIAMLSPGGFPAIDTARLETQTYQTEVFLDDHSACYTDVLNILRQIGVAILDKFGMQHDRQTSLPSTDNYTVTADELEAKVCQMIARDQNTAPVFRPGIFETMNATLAKDFAICNKIYEYTALLLIRVRLRQKRLDSLEVVAVIKNIIHLGRLIEPRTVLSPGLGLNTAFHTAGTYALDEDRRDIKELLLSFYQKTRSYSMKLALFHLDAERSERATVENTAISGMKVLVGFWQAIGILCCLAAPSRLLNLFLTPSLSSPFPFLKLLFVTHFVQHSNLTNIS